jgi:hypothetical protein
MSNRGSQFTVRIAQNMVGCTYAQLWQAVKSVRFTYVLLEYCLQQAE